MVDSSNSLERNLTDEELSNPTTLASFRKTKQQTVLQRELQNWIKYSPTAKENQIQVLNNVYVDRITLHFFNINHRNTINPNNSINTYPVQQFEYFAPVPAHCLLNVQLRSFAIYTMDKYAYYGTLLQDEQSDFSTGLAYGYWQDAQNYIKITTHKYMPGRDSGDKPLTEIMFVKAGRQVFLTDVTFEDSKNTELPYKSVAFKMTPDGVIQLSVNNSTDFTNIVKFNYNTTYPVIFYQQSVKSRFPNINKTKKQVTFLTEYNVYDNIDTSVFNNRKSKNLRFVDQSSTGHNRLLYEMAN